MLLHNTYGLERRRRFKVCPLSPSSCLRFSYISIHTLSLCLRTSLERLWPIRMRRNRQLEARGRYITLQSVHEFAEHATRNSDSSASRFLVSLICHPQTVFVILVFHLTSTIDHRSPNPDSGHAPFLRPFFLSQTRKNSNQSTLIAFPFLPFT